MPRFSSSATSIAADCTAAIEVDRALILALRPEAARRGTTVPRLINDLLDVIAADKLTGAILDQ
jgi:hypothetical protein